MPQKSPRPSADGRALPSLTTARHVDQTDVRKTHVMSDPLPDLAREVADLLNRVTE